MKFGLNEDTISKINSVFENYPEIEGVIIYGSRAKGTYRPGSEIDLALKGKDLSGSILSKINADIEELNTPYLFDILILDTLNSPELAEQIKRFGQNFILRK